MTIKSLTILDIDLIDSNEAILILNNLPNVQILNGRSTKEEEEEEFEEESNNNRNHLEEIEEDKNMENNSNYISSDNNIVSSDLTPRSAGVIDNILNGNINKNEKAFNKDNKMNNEIENIKKIKIKTNTLLYDKIISDDSNKKIISNTDSNKKEEIIENKRTNKSSYFSKFMIDITNEELNLLNKEKNNFIMKFFLLVKKIIY